MRLRRSAQPSGSIFRSERGAGSPSGRGLGRAEQKGDRAATHGRATLQTAADRKAGFRLGQDGPQRCWGVSVGAVGRELEASRRLKLEGARKHGRTLVKQYLYASLPITRHLRVGVLKRTPKQ